MPRQKAFQDYFPGNSCHGCGPANKRGLKIKSYWLDESIDWLGKDIAVCSFKPRLYHAAATPDIVNGGITYSLMDCHAIWTAIAARHRFEKREEFGSLPLIWYVTAGADWIRYPAPTPLEAELLVMAKVKFMHEKICTLETAVIARGIVTVKAEFTAYKVNKEVGSV